MKNFILLFLAMLIAVAVILGFNKIVTSLSPSPEQLPKKTDGNGDTTDIPEEETQVPSQSEEKAFTKAIWLSQYDLAPIYTSGNGQRKKDEFCELVGIMLDNCIELGFDTVIVQVRPNGDSMYPSKYFCASRYVTGQYGKDLEYDPFELIVSLCRIRGISVHAWINPLRLMSESQLLQISPDNILRKWWDNEETRGKYVVEFEDRLYLNPAYSEVRRLIADGASEIVDRYSVDGVHMDDYFYPHGIGEEFDCAAYELCGTVLNLGDWRRENISSLVSLIYSSVKAKDENAIFGISPGGNINTVFTTDYANIYEWCAKKGYIDYICPQIYFGMKHETQSFDATYKKWESIVTENTVSLYVGITFGKAESASLGIGDQYAGSGYDEWINSRRVLADCLLFLREREALDGICVFCYQYFFDPVTGVENENIADELENFIPVWKEF